uniref:Uncharacterized protein n=1 Tax=Pichia etchellsii TaxID=28550 RepID=Q9HFH8_PICET|nr:hypothetical protein [Schwanniomyces etchellsii]
MEALNDKVILDCQTIISHNMTWEEAKIRYNLNEGNIQRVYIRYLIILYGSKKVKLLLCDK